VPLLAYAVLLSGGVVLRRGGQVGLDLVAAGMVILLNAANQNSWSIAISILSSEQVRVDRRSFFPQPRRDRGIGIAQQSHHSGQPIAKSAMSLAVERAISGQMTGKSSMPWQAPIIWRLDTYRIDNF
jgi:hypothetical protein